jgi:hypothetical protein
LKVFINLLWYYRKNYFAIYLKFTLVLLEEFKHEA